MTYLRSLRQFMAAMLAAVCVWLPAIAQEQATPPPYSSLTPSASTSKPGAQQKQPDKRVFGVLPNYRTATETEVYTPLTTHQKFVIASKDSFDYPLVFVAAGLAGLGQLTNENPSLGQGLKGYVSRWGTSYADQVNGNMMTEAIFPTLLHEDPRYFWKGRGSSWSRILYAASRVLVTRTDSGGERINLSELLGNATAVAISNAYYPDGRTAGQNVERLGQQIGIDAFSQVLKEFWPDVKRKLFQRKPSNN